MSKQYKILWAVCGVVQNGSQLTSDIASVRLRCLEPLKFLTNLSSDIKPECKVISYHKPITLINCAENFKPDLIIFGKLFKPLESTVLQLKNSGFQIAFDICDDIFSSEHLAPLYKPFLKLGFHWIISSDYLFGIFTHKHNSEVQGLYYQIDDPIEGLPAMPRRHFEVGLGSCENQPLEIVWFGAQANIPFLLEFLNQKQNLYLSVTVVTQLDAALHKQLQTFSDNPKIHIQPVRWTLNTHRHSIMKSHVCVLPCGRDQFAKSKTANRLMTSLWFGTPVVASALPSYEPFQDYATLTENIQQGLESLIATPWDTITSQIEQAQLFIQNNYGLDCIGPRWLDTIGQIIKQKERS